MPCYSIRRRGQTDVQRRAEVKKAVVTIDQLLAKKLVQVKIGPQGAIAFLGIPNNVRDDLTDECVYRELQSMGSAAARIALERAEMMAGRKASPAAIQAGIHSHDGGQTWHPRG